MAQHYLNPKDAGDPHRLPSVETFYHDCTDVGGSCPFGHCEQCAEFECERGWYWQSCFPGCLPDGEAYGPFPTEADALADAREGIEDEDEDDGDNGGAANDHRA